MVLDLKKDWNKESSGSTLIGAGDRLSLPTTKDRFVLTSVTSAPDCDSTGTSPAPCKGYSLPAGCRMAGSLQKILRIDTVKSRMFFPDADGLKRFVFDPTQQIRRVDGRII
jgi:hypothetical protein